MANFHKCFVKGNVDAETRLVCKFCEILADQKSVKSRVAHQTEKKTQNFGTLSCSRFCADRAQNLSGTAPDNILGVPQISSKPFTSGGVIAGCVNVVEMRHKVFLILHENQGYDKWRTSEASAEGCKMAMWCTMWQKCW